MFPLGEVADLWLLVHACSLLLVRFSSVVRRPTSASELSVRPYPSSVLPGVKDVFVWLT